MIGTIEDSRTEFKIKLVEDLEETVIGFLNSKDGGNIYIGVDNNGNVIGLKNNLDLLNKYPILMVEYNKDGSKKQVEEIIKSINNLGKTEEERLSIYSCIFENKYEKSYDDEVIGKKSSRV